MFIRRVGQVFACLMAVAAALAHAGSALELGEKAMLQAAMQSHIDRSSILGRMPYVDEDKGRIEVLRLRAAHPLILRMGEFYILCADFEGAGGKDVNVDFYLARKDRGYVVFDQQVDNRGLVMRLMKSGKAVRAE